MSETLASNLDMSPATTENSNPISLDYGQEHQSTLPKVISEEFLTCKICYENFTRPKILDCLHSFCMPCLLSHAIQNSLTETLPCPICRQETRIPSGVSNLKDNFFIASLQETMKKSGNGDSGISEIQLCDQCSVHGEGRASAMKCLDCDEFLCEGCMESHQQKDSMANHTMALILANSPRQPDEGKQSWRPIPCVTHGNKVCRSYCEACEVLVCETCEKEIHDGHVLGTIQEGMMRKKETMKQEVDKVKDRICDYETMLKDWKDYHTKLEKQRLMLQVRLDRRCQELHHLVDGWHYTLTQQLNATCGDEKKCIATKVDHVELQLAGARSIRQLSHNLADVAQAPQFFTAEAQLQRDWSKLKSENMNSLCLTQKIVPEFNVGKQTLRPDDLGNFAVSYEKVLSTFSLRAVMALNFCQCFQTRQEDTGTRFDASAIEVTPQGNIIVTDRQLDKIRILRQPGYKMIGELNAALMGKPICSLMTPAGDLVFSRDKQSVCVFDETGRHKTNIKDNLSKPCSLALGPDKLLYVLDYHLKMITKFCTSSSFTKVGHVKLNYHKGSIWDKIGINSQGSIYLSAHNENCIYEFTPLGQQLARYGRWGSSGAGDLYWPRGLCIDACDNVIIADTHNDRLQMLSPTGSFTLLQTPDSEPVTSPCDVAVTNDGYLLVLQKCGAVRVYEYHPS